MLFVITSGGIFFDFLRLNFCCSFAIWIFWRAGGRKGKKGKNEEKDQEGKREKKNTTSELNKQIDSAHSSARYLQPMYEATRPAETKRESLLFFQTVYPVVQKTRSAWEWVLQFFAKKKQTIRTSCRMPGKISRNAVQCLREEKKYGQHLLLFISWYNLDDLKPDTRVSPDLRPPPLALEGLLLPNTLPPNLYAFWAERYIPWITILEMTHRVLNRVEARQLYVLYIFLSKKIRALGNSCETEKSGQEEE